MENEKINKKILKIVEDHKEKFSLPPVLYPKFNKGGILFIGLNPSSSEKALKKILKETEYPDVDPKELDLQNEEDCKILIEIERTAMRKKGASPYHDKFHEISEFVEVPFQHIDLFYFRKTEQKEAKKEIEKGPDKKFGLNDFGLQQLNIALEIIRKIEPKLIVVANAFASNIIREGRDREGRVIFKIDNKNFDKNCYDVLKIKKKKEIPIIFTSMLTGQRALDNGTLRTLKCQIKKIIEQTHL